MFTLSDASEDTKKILKWLGIGLIAVILLFILFKTILFIKDVLFPTPPPKPAVAYGKLQPAFFPKNATDKKLTYSINTISGKLPDFANQIKVFVINPNEPDLLALNKMKDKVQRNGFSGKPIKLSDQLYRWSIDPSGQDLPETIDVNIVDSSFSVNSNFLTNTAVLSGSSLPNQKNSIEFASDYLRNMGFLSSDLDSDKTKTKIFAIKNNSLSPATSISNAQIVQVNFYQKDINNLPVVYEDATASNIEFLVSGGGGPKIVAGKYINQSVTDNASTYPIITSEQAYEALKADKGFISSYFGSGTDIGITDVSLAYYISSKAQDFAIPVYVFVGNDGFYAYVTAVTDEWINK